MLRFFPLCLLLTLLLSNCEKDTSLTACPENGDFGLDVLAGPRFSQFPVGVWTYLSDKAGNVHDQQGPSLYPIFLNWLNHCEETYTLSIGQQVSVPAVGGGFWDFEVINSYFGIESGHQFRGGIRASAYESITGGTIVQTKLIEQIPPVDSTIVLGDQSITATYLANTEQLKVEIPNINLRSSTSNIMIGVRLIGEDFFRAVIVNLAVGELDDYTFDDFTERIFSREVSFAGHLLKRLDLSVLLSEEESVKMDIGNYWIEDNPAKVWLPALEKPYLMSYSGEYEDKIEWNINEVVTEVPTLLKEKLKPTLKISKDGRDFKLDISEHAYLFIRRESLPILPAGDGWTLEGPVAQGESKIRIPPLGADFAEYFPEQNLENYWDRASYLTKFTFYHYPALNSADEYWHLSESSWRDQLQYHSITVRIE